MDSVREASLPSHAYVETCMLLPHSKARKKLFERDREIEQILWNVGGSLTLVIEIAVTRSQSGYTRE